jgi:hypothetical protein
MNYAHQSRHLKFHEGENELGSQARGVELDGAAEANKLHHLHVVHCITGQPLV